MSDVNSVPSAVPAVSGDNYSFSDEFRSFWRRLPNKAIFFPLLVIWLALFHFLGNSTLGYVRTHSLFMWMVNAYTKDTPEADDGHGLIIPFVVLGLMWWKREQLLNQKLRLWWPGLVMLVGAMMLHLVGYFGQESRICIVAFFGGLYALMGLAWGPRLLRVSFFPFVLFAFMLPLGSMTGTLTFPLRLMVTKLVVFIGQYGLGADVVAVGTQLVNPSMQYQYEIAVPCSGMRSLIAITLIAVIYATIAIRGFWPRAALVAAAVPLAVIGNTFRMLLIVLAGQLGGQPWGNIVHENTIFSLTPYVPAILGLIWLGGKLEKRQGRLPAESRKEAFA